MPRVYDRMKRWPGGRLELVPGGRHETLMDTEATQARLFGLLCDFYGSTGQPNAVAMS